MSFSFLINYINKKVYIKDGSTFDPNKIIKKDDIFICMSSGSLDHVGKCSLITEDTDYYAGGFMGLFRCDKAKVEPVYLHYFLNSKYMKQVFRDNAPGTNIRNLSLSSIAFKLPALTKQKEFTKFYEETFTKIQKLKAQRKEQQEKLQEFVIREFD